jgi:hypothetical protein
MMTYCTKCGAELPEDARFCPSCGTPVAQAEEDPTREHYALKVVEKPKVVILQRAPGKIDVKKGTEGEVNVDLDLRERRDLEWSVTQEGNVMTIKARALVHPLRWPRYFLSGGPRADVAVSIPAEADLDISTSIGEVAVAGIRDTLSIESSVAKITMKECEGNVRVVGKTGPIDLRNIKGITTVDSTTGPATLENVNGTGNCPQHYGSHQILRQSLQRRELVQNKHWTYRNHAARSVRPEGGGLFQTWKSYERSRAG